MKKITKFNILLLLFLVNFCVICIIIFKKISPIIFKQSEFEIRNIVSNAISKSIEENLESHNLYTILKDDKGNIKSVDLNSVYINRLTINISRDIQDKLKKLELENKNKIICKIPISIIFNNHFFSNFGINIPIKIYMIGDAETNVETKLTDYGINNALIEIKLNIEIKEQMLIPFNKKTIVLKKTIPLSVKLIQGQIPDYYKK